MRTRFAFVPLVLSALVLAALHLPGCGKDKAPSAPSATPTPISSGSPSPTPPPTPPPGNASLPKSCQGVPPGSGTTSGCSRRSPNFLNEMRSAYDAAVGGSYLDPDSGQRFDIVEGGATGRILVPSAYMKTIISNLDAQGLCAVYDGEELNVRNGGGSFNDHYDVITGDGHAWLNYTTTCTPALPLPPLPPPPTGKPDPDCKLAPSRSSFCVKDSPVYDGDVYDAQDEVIAEDKARPTPTVFDFRERLSPNAPYSYKIINDSLYVQEMIKKLKKRGFCAFYDGEEFEVKRGTNTFSENYDLTKAEGFAIRIYAVTCRDAGY